MPDAKLGFLDGLKFPGSILNRGIFYGEGSCLGTAQRLTTPVTTEIYKANGYDIALVQRLLQHSSAAVKQRYIGIEPQRIEEAILNHVDLI